MGTVLVVVAVLWLSAAFFVAALCHAAARDDRGMRSEGR